MSYTIFDLNMDAVYTFPDYVSRGDAYKQIKGYQTPVNNKGKDGSNTCKNACIAIKKVKFNPPATVVFWSDGVKTVVKDQKLQNAQSFVVDEANNEITYVDSSSGTPLIESISFKQWKEEGLTYALVKRVIPLHQKILKTWC